MEANVLKILTLAGKYTCIVMKKKKTLNKKIASRINVLFVSRPKT